MTVNQLCNKISIAHQLGDFEAAKMHLVELEKLLEVLESAAAHQQGLPTRHEENDSERCDMCGRPLSLFSIRLGDTRHVDCGGIDD